MDDHARIFHEALDDAQFALAGASDHLDNVRKSLEEMAEVVDDRSELDALRGAAELIAYAIDELDLAVGQITADGIRHRPS
jgi:hypothetical protein